MIEASEFKKGQCIHFKGAPMTIVDVTFSAPTARGAATIAHTRLRNLLTGRLFTESVRGGERFAEVDVEKRACSFLYSDGSRWHFMDGETFDQFELSKDELGDSTYYLLDGLEGLRVLLIEGKVASIELPNTVDLRVTQTDPAIKGATATAQTKRAVLETGLEIAVPPYLETGQLVRIDTRDGHFVERVKS